jgi:hypothetical protein
VPRELSYVSHNRLIDLLPAGDVAQVSRDRRPIRVDARKDGGGEMKALAFFAVGLIPACASQKLTAPGRSEIELAGGLNEITDVSGNSKSELGGSVLFGYMLNEFAEVGALFGVAHGEVRSKDDDPTSHRFDVDQGLDVTDFTWGAVLRFNVPTRTSLVPFAEVATGFGSAEVEGEVETNNISVHVSSWEYLWFYQLGLGLRWFVMDDLAIVALGRYRWLDIADVDGTIESVQAMVGVSFTF